MYSNFVIKVINYFFLMTGLVFNQSSPLKIESLESKNKDLKPVFNKISLESSYQKDVWQMDQSHHGENPQTHQWERLFIIVDKSKFPYEASYYQLKPGSRNLKEEVEFRASCFTCHANGPRVIRANSQKLSFSEKTKIFYWNLKIKSYGKMIPAPKNIKQVNQKVPFWFDEKHENETLEVKTCLYCHNDGQWPNRSKIRRQQVGTMKFLIANHQMPPMGFSLSKKEKMEVESFINGF